MRHTHIHILFLCIAAVMAGCADQAPAPSTGSEGSDLAAIVAGAVGKKSHGLIADIQDLLAAANADSIDALRTKLNLPEANVHRVGFAANGSSQSGTTSFRFERNYMDTISEWKRSYTLTATEPTNSKQRVDQSSIVATATGQGIYRNGDLKLQAESEETLQIDRTTDGYQISGQHVLDGDATILTNNAASYHDVTVKLNLASLTAGLSTLSGLPALYGRCDVAVLAGSTHGTLSVMGTLSFDGSAIARLMLDGKEYLIDLERAQVITGA